MRNLPKKVFRQTLHDGRHLFGAPFVVRPEIPRPHKRGVTEFAQRISPEEAVMARSSGRIAASALSLAKKLSIVGSTTESIDLEVSEYIVSRKAFPSGIGFMGFPKAICQSVNEVVAHGIPDSRPLQSGDIVNFDITAYKDGFYGDNSDMALVGEVDEGGRKLVDYTREALSAATSVCRPGQKFSAIADAITLVAARGGFGVVDYFCGHFIGREMHIAPNIHHTRGYEVMDKLEMVPGMLFTIEPILTEGTTEANVWADGWTYVTKDNGRTAQAEHMVLITPNGHEILTLPDEQF